MQCSAQHQAVRHHTESTDGAARHAGCSGPMRPCVTARRRRQGSVGQVRECTGPAMPQHTYTQRAHNTHSPARLPVPVGRHPGLCLLVTAPSAHHTTPHHTTPHHTTPHHTTPHHTTPHHTTPHHTTPHHTTPHHTTLHYTTLHYTTLHYTLPCTTPHCTALHCAPYSHSQQRVHGKCLRPHQRPLCPMPCLPGHLVGHATAGTHTHAAAWHTHLFWSA